MLKKMNPNKTFIYWEQHRQEVEQDDIIQWWGRSKPLQINRKLIISLFGPFYIDRGVGNYLGRMYGNYSTWLDIYSQEGSGVTFKK